MLSWWLLCALLLDPLGTRLMGVDSL